MEELFIGGSKSFRYFKVISVNNKKITHSGRYLSKKYPQTAAKKAFTQLSKKYKTNKLTICIKETTQGSLKKEYGPYLVQKVKLKKPLEVLFNGNPVKIKYQIKIRSLKKNKLMKGSGNLFERTSLNNQAAAAAANNVKGLNNLEDENLEKHLLGKLNLRSLMKSRTSRQRKQTVNAMLQNENTLKKIFLETAQNDEEYIKRLYLKSLFGNIPFLQNKNNKDRFLTVMKEVMDAKQIVVETEYLVKWNEWCGRKELPELSYMIGGAGGGRDCSGDKGCGGEENGHIFTFYNIQVGNRYHFESSNFEGGRILKREDIQLTEIIHRSDSEVYFIELHFGDREINFQYCLPRSFAVNEGGQRIGWNVRLIGFSPSHISVFRPI